jgi:hypothetical protein
MPRSGSVTLGEIAGRLEMLRVECPKCGRAGQYRVMRLMKECGPGTLMPELLAKISGDCPKRQAGELHDPCRARMPDLGRLKI